MVSTDKIEITLPNGKKALAQQVDFKVLNETWNEYKLENGYILRIKPVVAEVYILDEKDPTTGFPNVLVKSANIISLKPISEEGSK